MLRSDQKMTKSVKSEIQIHLRQHKQYEVHLNINNIIFFQNSNPFKIMFTSSLYISCLAVNVPDVTNRLSRQGPRGQTE